MCMQQCGGFQRWYKRLRLTPETIYDAYSFLQLNFTCIDVDQSSVTISSFSAFVSSSNIVKHLLYAQGFYFHGNFFFHRQLLTVMTGKKNMCKITIYRRRNSMNLFELHLKCDRSHCNSKCAVLYLQSLKLEKELIIVIG